MLRPPLGSLALFVLLSLPTEVFAVGASLPDQVAVEGRAAVIRVELFDDPGVVERVEVEIQRPDGEWSARPALPDGGAWVATFPAEQHRRRAGEHIPVRASAYGARGGLLVSIGFDEPYEVAVLAPEAAARRRRDLRRSQPDTPKSEDDGIRAVVGLVARANDPARFRAEVGAELALTPTWAGVLRVGVGPGFSPPEDLDVGAIGVGLTIGAKRMLGTPGPGWHPFVAGQAELELRLPGFDAGPALEAGLTTALGPSTSFELALVGGIMVRNLDGGSPFAAARGGLRLGLSFGGG